MMNELAQFANPNFKREKIVEFQTANDIAKQLQRAEYNSRALSKKLAPFFKKSSDYETCRFLWQWLVKNIDYKAEPEANQTAKEIARFIVEGYGDCKHYATTAVGILNACGIPTYFSLVGQDVNKKQPNHIYAISIVNGKQVIIDPCRKEKFDDECKYFYKWSCQPINIQGMSLSYLSGDQNQTVVNDLLYNTEIPPITSGTKEPLTPYLDGNGLALMKTIAPNTSQLPSSKIYLDVPTGYAKNGQYFLVVNGKRVNYYLKPVTGSYHQGQAQYTWQQGTQQTQLFMTPAAAKALTDSYVAKNGSKSFWDKIRDAVNTAATNVVNTTQDAIHNVEQTVTTAVATVTNAVARTTFLAAVNANAGGLAIKLLNTYKVAPDEVKSTFTDMGGNWDDLKNAIARGSGVAIGNDQKRKAGYTHMGDDDNSLQAFQAVIIVFKEALPYIIKFFQLFKKHNTAGTPAEQAAMQSAIDTGTNALAIAPNITKLQIPLPPNTSVAVLPIDPSKLPVPTNPPGDGTVSSFFSPLGLFFKTPLLLALMNVQNHLVSLLFGFVSLYCFVGLILFPFYQWNWLNLREFVSPFVELPKKIFYGAIKKIC